MSEAENPSSKIFAQPLAITLGVVLLAGYAVVTGFAIYQRAHRPSIEHADASNGVGDMTLISRTFDPTLPLVNFEGHSFYFVDRAGYADTSMVKVGMDDANTYVIYKQSAPTKEEAFYLYLKAGSNYYLKIKRQ